MGGCPARHMKDNCAARLLWFQKKIRVFFHRGFWPCIPTFSFRFSKVFKYVLTIEITLLRKTQTSYFSIKPVKNLMFLITWSTKPLFLTCFFEWCQKSMLIFIVKICVFENGRQLYEAFSTFFKKKYRFYDEFLKVRTLKYREGCT